MLSLQSFEQLSKCKLYQIYVDAFKNVNEEDDLIKNYEAALTLQHLHPSKKSRQDGEQVTYNKNEKAPQKFK